MASNAAPTSMTSLQTPQGGVAQGLPLGGGGVDAIQQQQSLVNNAQNQIMQAAMQQQSAGSTVDMSSVLAKIQSLEAEKQNLQSALDSSQTRLTKLQEAKSVEMKTFMENVMSGYLDHLETLDVNSKEKLRDGLNKLVEEGNESGVWEVMACASSTWKTNVNELERLINENNSFREKEKQLQGGLFQSERARFNEPTGMGGGGDGLNKRKADDIDRSPATDVWGEFESMVQSRGGIVPVNYEELHRQRPPGEGRDNSVPLGFR